MWPRTMYSTQQTCCLWLLLGLSVWSAFEIEPGVVLPPVSWAIISLCAWLAYAVLRPERKWDKTVVWGVLASCIFCSFLAQDPSFRSWGDVYFFCGPKMQYCTCSFRWNMAGWYKAFVLWNFVLLTALGIQRLVIQLGLCGLLPGEEVVTRESFISICWRLIPYWLNNWEQQWGAECSSMMFELPHFAVELLIILPCVQILCSRMKVLAMPSVNAALPPGRNNRPEVVREECVPNVLRGCWERQPKQRHIWHRIRANKRIITFSCLLCLMAGFNALYVPLHLEDLILRHPDAPVTQLLSRLPDWQDAKGLSRIQQGIQQGSLAPDRHLLSREAAQQAAGVKPASNRESFAAGNSSTAAPAVSFKGLSAVEAALWQKASWSHQTVERLFIKVHAYKAEPRQCVDFSKLRNNMLKHHEEISRMQDPEHRMTIPLVEVALALMRLSTEKFFVLMSLYVAFLVFRIPPKPAAYLINLNARISHAFARLIVYSFPAVCWIYGAGFIFSTFVSVVFWGGPLMQLYEFFRSNICTVSIKSLRPATAAEIERMHGDCAICWCEMTVAPGADRPRQDTSTSTTNAVQDTSGCASPAVPQSDGVAVAAQASAASADSVQPQQQSLGAEAEAFAQQGLQEQQQQQHAAHDAEQATENASAAAAEPGHAEADQAGPVIVAAGSLHGYTLRCSHAYHYQCLNQWLQQCHGQGVTPTCPMCQAALQLDVQWHILGARRRRQLDRQQLAELGAAAVDADAANNYLLEHQPRLADMLADMPIILAQENVQLLAEVQDLRIQRQQLVGELQLRQQQLQELAGRQQQMELEGMEMEQQRRQLLQELHLLRRARDRQRQLQQLAGQRGTQEQQDRPASSGGSSSSNDKQAGSAAGSGLKLGADAVQQWRQVRSADEAVVSGERDELAAAGGLLAGDHAEGMNRERFRQLQLLLDAMLREQEAAGGLTVAAAATSAAAELPAASTSDVAVQALPAVLSPAPAAAPGPGTPGAVTAAGSLQARQGAAVWPGHIPHAAYLQALQTHITREPAAHAANGSSSASGACASNADLSAAQEQQQQSVEASGSVPVAAETPDTRNDKGVRFRWRRRA